MTHTWFTLCLPYFNDRNIFFEPFFEKNMKIIQVSLKSELASWQKFFFVYFLVKLSNDQLVYTNFVLYAKFQPPSFELEETWGNFWLTDGFLWFWKHFFPIFPQFSIFFLWLIFYDWFFLFLRYLSLCTKIFCYRSF